MMAELANFAAALNDFRRARSRAQLQEVIAYLTGRSAELLSYEDVRQKLKLRASSSRGLQDIPLNAIVGSVNRYHDFTRDFLPRQDEDAFRWAGVQAAMTDLTGLPPIEVYQVGQVYFVLDGNHRVSVARQFGATHIQAYVTEVPTRVPLTPDIQPDELIIKARYAEFLERTQLDEIRPGADLSVTVPGQYRVLDEHIQLHRYFMGLEQQREIPWEEAVGHWYDMVYMPVVQFIRERGLLRDFPGRTETDLYLWLSEHHAALKEALGWDIDSADVAADLVAHYSPTPQNLAARVGGKILDAVLPDELETGPPPGEWRRRQGWGEAAPTRRQGFLFPDILVPVSGAESGWYALEQAIVVARRENGRLLGLHVVPEEKNRDTEAALAVKAEFEQRCQAAGIDGRLAIETGSVTRKICERTRWADLVTLNLAYPPDTRPLARLSSGIRTLIQRCASPILTVPGPVSPMDRLLLAYDGSPKAEEALFVTAYLAARWQAGLVVVTATENSRVTSETLARARQYLETQGLAAEFVQPGGPAAPAILAAAETHQSNLIIMGGYGFKPVLEVLLGSAIDQILRASQQPVLICR